MHQPNALIHTTSPYLLQHAYNPIYWYPWGEEALIKAQQEDKPILLSIGYAACHWCHVMARESFEDEEVAAIMNKYFVCIKVDREERPDIDQVYMAAMQAMGLPAGWPLNVFLFPNQQPFYGGTYFPTKIWKQLIENIARAFKNNRQQLAESASQFTKNLHANTPTVHQLSEPTEEFSLATIKQIFQTIYQSLDHEKGGIQGTPKFPMPSIGAFLLDYYRLTQDAQALDQLKLTLTNMAYGGIYDQLGGGFCRYATDEDWLIPHFEKMLYDNAQLISLYASTYLTTQDALYKSVVEQTITFIEQEMMDEKGGFYGALDADSEGLEGKFYTWTQQEIKQILGKDAPLLIEYYNLTEQGNWKHGANILHRNLIKILETSSLNQEATQKKLQQAQKTLFDKRKTKKRPALDDKILTSWNGMMLQALVDAYYALGDARLLDLALQNAAFIVNHLMQEDDSLWHTCRKGQVGAIGYLEDYAWVAKAFISLYQATFEEEWLYKAEKLVVYAIKHCWDDQAKLFYFTEQSAKELIIRPREVFDQVIPSSNAVMAHNLLYLSILLDKEVYATIARQMLRSIDPLLHGLPLHLTHWASFYMLQLQVIPTVAIVGSQCKAWARAVKQKYPQVLVVGTVKGSNLPLLIDKKTDSNKATIYICCGKTCQAPVHSLEEAFIQLNT
jgi:hypothetical protein